MTCIVRIGGCQRVYAAADTITALRAKPVHAADARSAARLTSQRIPEHLAARVLLRRLLSEAVGGDAASSPLATRPGGQPFLAERPDVGVSLSHSDGWVAAAVHLCGVVGVDVQAPVRPSDRLIRRCCTPSARRALSVMTEPERDTEFAWIWSVQEACVKAEGLGVAGLPWTIAVQAGQRVGRLRDLRWRALRQTWPVPVSCAHGPAKGDEPPCGD